MESRHYIVCGLGFGDEGKGSVIDFLCSPRRPDPARTVIRFNGGAQAAHNVLTADGRHHTFAQFGSGSFTSGVRTHLSRFVLVDPLALAAEADGLASAGVPDALDRLTVDRDALLVTPYHQAANRAREAARGRDRHGSCGMGIGETARYALAWPGDGPRVADCAAPRALARSLGRLRDRLCDELGPLGGPSVDSLCDVYRTFANRVALVDGGYLRRLLRAGPAVFEGAQGILLDEWRGFHPYTTWSTTTFANAETLLAEAGLAEAGLAGAGLAEARDTAVRLGVVRCYLTRHGPGPFVTEDPTLEFPEPHNGTGTWQGAFRIGHPDAVALRYAAEVAGGVDGVALTHLDVAARHRLRLCRAYQADGRMVSRIEPGPEHDLSWQERLTDSLLRARPVYSDPVSGCGDPVSGDPAGDWAGVFEDVLGAPVVLRSYGPTAAAKRGLQATPVLPLLPGEGGFQQGAELGELGFAERAERAGLADEPLPERGAQAQAGAGQDDALHPAVPGIRAPFHRAELFQPVDDAGQVGRVVLNPAGERAHRHRAVLIELDEDLCLDRRQRVLGGQRAEVLLQACLHLDPEADHLAD